MTRSRAPRPRHSRQAAYSWAAVLAASARRLFLVAAVLGVAPASAQVSGNFPGDAAKTLPALTNAAQAIKGTLGTASPGTVQFAHCSNPNASTTEWLQFFDTTSAITLGTTTPKFSIPIAAGVDYIEIDVRFSVIPSVAATTTASGGTAPASVLQCNFTFR